MRTKRSTLGARLSDIKGDRVTTQNEREAVHQARQEAERETIAALRSFTGIAPSTVHRILVDAHLNRLSHVDRATGSPSVVMSTTTRVPCCTSM